MAYLLKGALVEYGTDFLGPIPNIVIFQFNPESLKRDIQIPERPTGAAGREVHQAGEVPLEKISFTAYFSAADKLGVLDPIAVALGITPQLSALEQMIHPASKISELIGQAIDAVGNMLGGGSSEPSPNQPTPRESYPRILFIWGLTKILPVIIESVSITEQKYNSFLIPVEAEVVIGLNVIKPTPGIDDKIAKGAYEYTSITREAQAMINLANTAEQVIDLIPF